MSTPATFEEMIDACWADARKIALSRQLKYGPNNIPKFGVKGVLVRIYDKIERAIFFWWEGSPKPEDEGDEDPFIDLINYSIFCLCLMRGWWSKSHCPPLEEKVLEKYKGIPMSKASKLALEKMNLEKMNSDSDLHGTDILANA